MPAFPALPDSLHDGDVALRLYAERDIPEILIAYQDDPELHLRMGEARPPSGAELGRRAEQASSRRAAGVDLVVTILEPGSDEFRGQVNVHGVDWDHLRAELQIWVVPQARGRGLGCSALALVAAWLVGGGTLERLQMFTEPSNRAMIAAATAAGFRPEGILRGYLRERGSRVDCAVYALVSADLASPAAAETRKQCATGG